MRVPGERVWVQRIEAEPNDWVECEVIELSEDPITQDLMYRVKLVDSGGTLFEEGKWLHPDRLRGKDDRKRPYDHFAYESTGNQRPVPPMTSGYSTASMASVSSRIADKRKEPIKRKPKPFRHEFPNTRPAEDMSNWTHGGESHISQATRELLIHDFAELVVQSLNNDVPKEFFGQPDVSVLIASFLRAFSSMLIAGIASDSEGSALNLKTAMLIQHERTLIAAKVVNLASTWTPDDDGMPSAAERVAAWDAWEAEPLGRSEFIDAGGIPLQGEAALRLPNVFTSKAFLLQSEELKWLLQQLRASAAFLQTGSSSAYARNEIAAAMDEYDGWLNLTLDWDLKAMLDKQYHGVQTYSSLLSNMVVYIGSPSSCFATTASQYAHQIWPAVSSKPLTCLEIAVSSNTNEATTTSGTIRMTVRLSGAVTRIELSCINQGYRAYGLRPRMELLEVSTVLLWTVAKV